MNDDIRADLAALANDHTDSDAAGFVDARGRADAGGTFNPHAGCGLVAQIGAKAVRRRFRIILREQRNAVTRFRCEPDFTTTAAAAVESNCLMCLSEVRNEISSGLASASVAIPRMMRSPPHGSGSPSIAAISVKVGMGFRPMTLRSSPRTRLSFRRDHLPVLYF